MAERIAPEEVVQRLASLGPPGEEREHKLEVMRQVLSGMAHGGGRVPDWWEDLWDLVHEGAL